MMNPLHTERPETACSLLIGNLGTTRSSPLWSLPTQGEPLPSVTTMHVMLRLPTPDSGLDTPDMSTTTGQRRRRWRWTACRSASSQSV